MKRALVVENDRPSISWTPALCHSADREAGVEFDDGLASIMRHHNTWHERVFARGQLGETNR